MPYKIVKRGDQFCVVKKADNKSVGCSPTLEKAKAHMAALHANVRDAQGTVIDPTYRAFALRIQASGTVRTERWDGIDYTVLPVTMLMEGVIRAINSPHPEFVPAERLAVAPSGWDGRPIFHNHPMNGAEPVSGNSPEVLRTSIGRLHNTHYESSSKSLKGEAWLHPEKAKDVIERWNEGETIEISTGAFVLLSEGAGNFNGRMWKGRWDTIVPDHLAILDPGLTGACSTTMGCGIRASMHLVNAEGQLEILGGPGSGPHKGGGEKGHESAAKLHDKAAMEHAKLIGKPDGTSSKDAEAATAKAHAATKSLVSEDGPVGVASSRSAKTESSKGNHANAAVYHTQAAISHRIEAKSHRDFNLKNSQEGDPMAEGKKKGKMRALLDRMKALVGEEDPEEELDDDDDMDEDVDDEDAEDVLYNSMKSMFAQADTALSEVRGILDDLIKDNNDNDDEEVEEARLQTVQQTSYLVSDILMRISSLTSKLLSKANDRITKVQVVGSVPYAMRAAKGAEFSKKNKAMIQTIHDHTTTMGADCKPAMRSSSSPCGCQDGTGTSEGEDMKSRPDRIAALMVSEHSPVKDKKFLDELSDDGLAAMEAHVQTSANLRAAASKDAAAANDVIKNLVGAHKAAGAHADKLESDAKAKADKEKKTDNGDGDMKAAIDAAVAAAMPKTEEDWLKIAPQSVRSLVSDAKERDATIKAELVTKLKAAQKVYSEDDLKTMDVKQLQKIAALMNVETENVDFSGLGAPRIAQEGDDDYFSKPAPDGYAIALGKKSNGEKEKVN